MDDFKDTTIAFRVVLYTIVIIAILSIYAIACVSIDRTPYLDLKQILCGIDAILILGGYIYAVVRIELNNK